MAEPTPVEKETAAHRALRNAENRRVRARDKWKAALTKAEAAATAVETEKERAKAKLLQLETEAQQANDQAKEKGEQVHAVELEITALVEEYNQVRKSAVAVSEVVVKQKAKPASAKEERAWSKLESKLVESLRKQAAEVGRDSEAMVYEIKNHVAKTLLDARIAVDSCLQDEDAEEQKVEGERSDDDEMEAPDEEKEDERQSMWNPAEDDQSSEELIAASSKEIPTAAESNPLPEDIKHHEEAPNPKQARVSCRSELY